MPLTNFPQGVSSFGMPIIGGGGYMPAPTGNVFFVSSVTGTAGGGQNVGTSPSSPFATLAQALAYCKADNGDIIYLLPKHAETIIGAAGIAIATAGVTIIGVGYGAERPVFTYTTNVAATMTITAANVTMRNFVTKIGLDQIVSPIVISGANCFLDMYEHQDGSAILEAVEAILTTAGASNLQVNMKYVGFTAGTHCTAAIKLVGVAGGRINMDFYGKASTAVVNFITTLSSNIVITGFAYNSGTTDSSKDVVDTITGSLWFAWLYSASDSAAGSSLWGGGSSATYAKRL